MIHLTYLNLLFKTKNFPLPGIFFLYLANRQIKVFKSDIQVQHILQTIFRQTEDFIYLIHYILPLNAIMRRHWDWCIIYNNSSFTNKPNLCVRDETQQRCVDLESSPHHPTYSARANMYEK